MHPDVPKHIKRLEKENAYICAPWGEVASGQLPPTLRETLCPIGARWVPNAYPVRRRI